MRHSRPRSMSVREYKEWIKDSRSRDASEKDFFKNGVRRTINVLEGDSLPSSVAKRDSFVARHYAQYKDNPTYKRAVALRNWGFKVSLPNKKD